MKTKKVKMMMPIFAIVFAIAGAFATNSMDKEAAAPVVGYLDAPTPCSLEVQCSTIPGPICTVKVNGEDVQAFGKFDENGTTCLRTLYQPMQ